jgi:hypothetical protein
MPGRGSRRKPKAPLPLRVAPPEEATTQMEMSPELLASLRDDEGDRPTVRLPSRPPFAPDQLEPEIPIEDAGLPHIPMDAGPDAPADEPPHEATIRQRVIVGPDGVARMLGDAELEEATRPFIPSKVLLQQVRSKKKKR